MAEVKVEIEVEGTMKPTRACCETLVGCILPPVFLCMRGKKGCGALILNIILTILFIFPGVIHAFWLDGVPCLSAFLCVFLPPVGLYCSTKKCNLDILICFLLTLCWIGGVWYAFWKA